MSGPSVHLTIPPASLFKFPPAPLPETLPPPQRDYSFATPFNINPTVYNGLLSASVPLTFATIYATSVVLLNQINRRRGNQPWEFSKTRLFHLFVVAHNVLLAVYSAWTLTGMLGALSRSWPGFDAEGGPAEVADALCKLNGPRGFGSAATYNSTTSAWGVTDRLVKLGTGGIPDSSDVGRLWNEGLSFYGWLFYLSKFYEVVDTAIILAKGKRSSSLQTYHHAGAMMCMWAGIRYMAPPIWLFVVANSFIHTLMYTYFTLTALHVKVPWVIKRTLTTMQIAQFVIGASFAATHLFVSYNAPVSVPYSFIAGVSSAASSATSAVGSAATSVASATATANLNSWFKKLALRAVGEEGLAENVRNSQGERFGADAVKAPVNHAKEEIRYRTEYPVVSCIDTSGQSFAIWLNLMYLAPLTWLFVRFFIRSYTGMTSRRGRRPSTIHIIEKSGLDAARGVQRELDSLLKEAETSVAEKVIERGEEAASSAEAAVEAKRE
ncbi:hypothetical protein L228DRAFT_244925 [Xylona heveae TC161]|uniref:Elongation of fatty acids protein n=1 Tax=Xylona heveae (strain CBS 132557 / TC161) TaxID=1328760 RepID=A0A165HX89_XYLHT|nr:hypothetical protein L228DRAFT_244925 [Xylona heveae TC161]KZF24055.1 hypothetical protein L228DRAFT_244925 [Xylona heveae TC161]